MTAFKQAAASAISLGDGVKASGETVRSARTFSLDRVPSGGNDGCEVSAAAAEVNYHERATEKQREREEEKQADEDRKTSKNFIHGVAYVLLAALGLAALRWWWSYPVLERLGARAAAWETEAACAVPPAAADAADATYLSREKVQHLTSCWRASFRALQAELAQALRDAGLHGAAQTPAYLHCCRACAVVALWGALWGVVYLDVIPSALANLWHLPALYRVLGSKQALLALLLLALAFVPRGVLLHADLQELCVKLQRKHEGFYADLQRAAVFSVHVPPHACDSLQRHATLDLWAVGAVLGNKAFTFFFIIPCLKVLQQAWHKSKKHFRERRDAKERYCDVVNFSVTMFLPEEGSAGEPSLSLKFRTLCEMPTDKLVHNWHTLKELKKASRFTTHEFPLLHTLTSSVCASVNLLCLNNISELVGADFFAMNEPALIPSTMQDYCFALTCERYEKAGHEDKLRCIIVKKDVLDQIVKRERPFDRRSDTPEEIAKWLKLERPNHSWRWNTTMAMAFAFADEACKTNAVWSVQIPVHAPRSTLGCCTSA